MNEQQARAYNDSLDDVSRGLAPTMRVIEPGWPEACRYAPHPLTMTDEYQELARQSTEHGMMAGRFHALASEATARRSYYLSRAKNDEDSPYRDPTEIKSFYGRLATAVGPTIGDALRKAREHSKAQDECQQKLIEMERAYNEAHPAPESERWMKHAMEGIEI